MEILEKYRNAVCFLCKHLVSNPAEFYCKAFPCGIPKQIMLGQNDHKAIVDGQVNDIVFEQKENDYNDE